MGLTGNAQNNNNDDKLIGTWVLDYNKTLNNIKQEAKQYYDGMTIDRKQSLQNSFNQRKMIFEADGNYTLVINSERQVTGTWDLKQDDITLELVAGGRTITHSIGNLSNQNLELHLEKSTEAKQLLGTWYLDKVSN
ncbi:lipocalin family protein [Pontimicrobium sp. SW4]|uniref:Lipocalin family protein n=1 Tax=Pontimicrobium sp. SW4 TaxID=3153519 RepID=A0AAU7BUF2_9FLAO